MCGYCNWSRHPASVHPEHCSRGHPLDVAGVYRYGRRTRCRACQREDNRTYVEAHRPAVRRKQLRAKARARRRARAERAAATRQARSMARLLDSLGYPEDEVMALAWLIAEVS